MHVIKIYPKPPYRILLHLRTFSIEGEPVPCIVDGITCRRCLREICWKTIIVREGDEPFLKVLVFSGDLAKAEKVVRRIYNVEFDYNILLMASKKYPELHKIVKKYSGLRPALSATMWESLIKAIVMQRIMLKFALKVISKLVKKFGRKVVLGDESFYDFPTPETLKDAENSVLRSLGLSRNKVNYIKNISILVSKGVIDLEEIAKKKPENAVNELTSLGGVGPWTAKLAYIAYTGYMGLDLFEDSSVRRALLRLNVDVEKIKSDFKENIGYLLYLISLKGKH